MNGPVHQRSDSSLEVNSSLLEKDTYFLNCRITIDKNRKFEISREREGVIQERRLMSGS